MITPEVKYNLESLRQACVTYGKLSGKSESETLAKQGPKLSWNIWEGLRSIRPAKGSIRAERLAAIARGGGIKVREAVLDAVGAKHESQIAKGKKTFGKAGLNLWQLAVQREINVRESGIGFLAYSTPRPKNRSLAEETQTYEREVVSKYNFPLSDFKLDAPEAAEHKYASLRWMDANAGQVQSPLEGMNKPEAQAIIAAQIQETEVDIQKYILRKLEENAKEAGFK